MDVINDVAGYTEKYYQETAEKMSHEDLIAKYRAERDRCEAQNIPITKSLLLGETHPHCLLVLEGI